MFLFLCSEPFQRLFHNTSYLDNTYKNSCNSVNINATEFCQISLDSQCSWLSGDNLKKYLAFILTELRPFLRRLSAGGSKLFCTVIAAFINQNSSSHQLTNVSFLLSLLSILSQIFFIEGSAVDILMIQSTKHKLKFHSTSNSKYWNKQKENEPKS